MEYFSPIPCQSTPRGLPRRLDPCQLVGRRWAKWLGGSRPQLTRRTTSLSTSQRAAPSL